MSIVMNNLESDESVREYKEWLSKKPLRYLKGILTILQKEERKKETHYTNLPIRIQLVREEIFQRTLNT